MKKLLLLALLFFNVSLYAQSEIKITPKKCIPKKGFHLKLKKIVNDSRCPENVNCIWAGEVSVIVEVYNNKKLVEEKTITFNTTNREENILWFSNYFPTKVKNADVAPYPKDGVIVKQKNQYITISF